MLLKLSSRGQIFNRPTGPVRANLNSWSAKGLVAAWYANTSGVLQPMIGNCGIIPARPVILAGSPVTEVTAPVGRFLGLMAQSESNGSSIQRAFASSLPGPLDGLTECTIAYWVYFNTSLSNANHYSWWGQGDASTSSFCETSADLTGPFIRGLVDARGLFTEHASLNEWQHLVWTIVPAASQGVRYYQNGRNFEAFGAPAGSVTPAATNGMYIGGQPTGDNGAIAVPAYWADFRVYNYGMTTQEVSTLYLPTSRWELYWQPTSRLFMDLAS